MQDINTLQFSFLCFQLQWRWQNFGVQFYQWHYLDTCKCNFKMFVSIIVRKQSQRMVVLETIKQFNCRLLFFTDLTIWGDVMQRSLICWLCQDPLPVLHIMDFDFRENRDLMVASEEFCDLLYCKDKTK